MNYFANQLSLNASCLKIHYDITEEICKSELHTFLYKIKKHNIKYEANDPNKIEIGHLKTNEDIIDNIINVIDMQKSLFYDCSDIIIPQVLMLINILCERNSININSLENDYFREHAPQFFLDLAYLCKDYEELVSENMDYFVDCCLSCMSAYKSWEFLPEYIKSK